MIIDSHTHLGFFGKKIWKPQDLIKSMDLAGIDYSLVLANKLDRTGITTEEAIKISKVYSRLFPVAYAETAPNQISLLLKKLEKGVVKAVKFYPGYNDYYPSDKKFQPIYKYCQESKVPVIFHTGILATGFKGLLKQSHPLNIDEIANKYSKLKIVIAHFGNPWILDCAAVVWKNPNVYVDLSGYFAEFSPISKEDSDAFVRQMTEFKSFVGDFKKVIFGTDWPFYSQKEYLAAVKKLPMSKEEEELIFWKNANQIFNLEINS